MTSPKSLRACALVVLLLQGCAALPGSKPPPLDTYDLTAPTVEAPGPRRSRTQILIAEPSALKVLDGQDIVVRPAPGSVEVLAGAQWADRLPRIVQARLVEAFQGTNRLGGVGKPGEGLAIDYQVVTEIRSFEVRVDGTSSAHIELYVKLLNDRNGIVLNGRSFTASAPLSGSDNDDYVAALDSAFGAVQADVVGWVLASL